MATIGKRTAKDRTTRYRVRVRPKGDKPRTRTFDAKAWASNVETDLGRGAHVPTTAERRKTLADLIDKFIAEQLPIRPNNADRAKLEAQLAWWKQHAGYLTLERVTPAAIAGFRSELLARKTGRAAPGAERVDDGLPIAPSTVNRYLAALSAVCKWAWKELRWLPSNPVLSVTKGPEHAGIIRFLSDKKRTALIAACKASTDPNIYTAVMLALATGARAGNLRALAWDDVDLKRWTLRFVHTKNQQPRYVPLVGPAQAVLKAHQKRDPTAKGWVFKARAMMRPARSMALGEPFVRPLDSSVTSTAGSTIFATRRRAI